MERRWRSCSNLWFFLGIPSVCPCSALGWWTLWPKRQTSWCAFLFAASRPPNSGSSSPPGSKFDVRRSMFDVRPLPSAGGVGPGAERRRPGDRGLLGGGGTPAEPLPARRARAVARPEHGHDRVGLVTGDAGAAAQRQPNARTGATARVPKLRSLCLGTRGARDGHAHPGGDDAGAVEPGQGCRCAGVPVGGDRARPPAPGGAAPSLARAARRGPDPAGGADEHVLPVPAAQPLAAVRGRLAGRLGQGLARALDDQRTGAARRLLRADRSHTATRSPTTRFRSVSCRCCQAAHTLAA
jgi:hypothetical protein